MRNKGLVLFFTILISLACLYCLSFTVVTKSIEKDAKEYATSGDAYEKALSRQIDAYKAKNGNEPNDLELSRIKNEVQTTLEREYLDRMRDSSVWLGFTYGQSKEKEINLGLDLQGGMSITLVVSSPEIVEQKCSRLFVETDEFLGPFNEAVAKYKKGASGDDFLDIYAEMAEKNNQALYKFFGGKDELDMDNASNEEIIKALKDLRDKTVDATVQILSKRVDRYGVAQPTIQKDASGRIVVELPGVKDKERVENLLQSTAQLEFWKVVPLSEKHPKAFHKAVMDLAKEAGDNTELQKAYNKIAEYCSLDANDHAVINMPLADTNSIKIYSYLPEIKEKLGVNYVYYWTKPEKKRVSLIPLALANEKGDNDVVGPVLSSKTIGGDRMIQNAEQNVDEHQRVIVNMSMESKAADEWKNITTDYKGECIAIVLDEVVYSYPRINDVIANGRSQISGNFDVQEAKELAIVLNSGGLDVHLDVIASDVVGPSLGERSIKSGLLSFALAFVLVLIYMFLYYDRAGLVADIALLTNVFFMVGVLASLGSALTLPGMAGIVLTLGMAVDANVLIYERIREEVRNGKGMRLAVADGYKNAYSAIIDGNVTTLITGFVLYLVGSGPVKGFAITLIIGILSSLFTAIFISRMIFERRLAKGKTLKFGNSKTLNAFTNTHFNFLGTKKIAYIISSCLIGVVIISFFVFGMQVGIDFAGGRTYIVQFDHALSKEQVQQASEAVTAEFGGSPQVKTFGSSDRLRVLVNYMVNEPSPEIEEKCQDKLYNSLSGIYNPETGITKERFKKIDENDIGILSTSRVQAAMAHELILKAIISVLISLVLIFIYIAIRFRNWQFGLGSILVLCHDTLITIGMFAIFRHVLPLEVDQQFIAAVLTVIGYSINNVVIIYDRVRENLTLTPKAGYTANFNNAVNSTLGRNINTCGTTIMVLLVIFIMGFFGGENIQGFVFAMLMGIICGTYSGIFIAPAIAHGLLSRSKKKANVAKIQLLK